MSGPTTLSVLVALAALVGSVVWASVERGEPGSDVRGYLAGQAATSPVGLIGDGAALVPRNRATVRIRSLADVASHRPAWVLLVRPIPRSIDPDLVEWLEQKGREVAADRDRTALYRLDAAAHRQATTTTSTSVLIGPPAPAPAG